jgi:regulator of protease activity HflC (stomatin/prohibitin superfamily)
MSSDALLSKRPEPSAPPTSSAPGSGALAAGLQSPPSPPTAFMTRDGDGARTRLIVVAGAAAPAGSSSTPIALGPLFSTGSGPVSPGQPSSTGPRATTGVGGGGGGVAADEWRQWRAKPEDAELTRLGFRNLSEAELPFYKPNVDPSGDNMSALVNGDRPLPAASTSCCNCWATCCCGCFCSSCVMPLSAGQLGFSASKGRTFLHADAGFHWLCSPFETKGGTYSRGASLVREGNVTIVRVNEGSLGWVRCNALTQILLPGVHVRVSGSVEPIFNDSWVFSIDAEISTGTIRAFQVPPAEVRICSRNGVIEVVHPGRYVANEAGFKLLQPVSTAIQWMHFSDKLVYTKSRVALCIKGLLHFKIDHPENFVRTSDEANVAALKLKIEPVVESMMRAEFQDVELERVMATSAGTRSVVPEVALAEADSKALFGKQMPDSKRPEGSTTHDARAGLEHHILESVQPRVTPWGVKILDFYFETIDFGHASFQTQQEQMAITQASVVAEQRKALAERATQLILAENAAQKQRVTAESANENQRLLLLGENERAKLRAEGERARMVVEAEARKNVVITDAEAKAKAIEIEAKARKLATIEAGEAEKKRLTLIGEGRQEAADAMKTQFARDLQALEIRSECAARSLPNLTTLVNNTPDNELLPSIPGMVPRTRINNPSATSNSSSH